MTAKSVFPILILMMVLLVGTSCKKPASSAYQKQVPVPGAQWSYDFQPEFKIHITDTAKHYQSYFLLRHDELFRTSNIWIRWSVKTPGDSVFVPGPRIEKTLAEPGGKWLARGMSGIWEHKIPLGKQEAPQFTDTGVYIIKLEQIMRDNPLHAVLNIGLSVEAL